MLIFLQFPPWQGCTLFWHLNLLMKELLNSSLMHLVVFIFCQILSGATMGWFIGMALLPLLYKHSEYLSEHNWLPYVILSAFALAGGIIIICMQKVNCFYIGSHCRPDFHFVCLLLFWIMPEVLVECRSSHYLWTRKAGLLTGHGKSQISHDFQRQIHNGQFFLGIFGFFAKPVPTPKIS